MNSSELITDAFGRVHDYLRISLTERCNLRCFYCMPEEGVQLTPKENTLAAHEIISIAKTFTELGVKKIRLTGGEPLVRNDAAYIIGELSKLNVELAITTNGILLDKYIDLFEKINLRNINVSLDTLSENKFNTITRRNYFEKVKKNIDLLLSRNFHVKLNVVLIKGVNDNEITDFIDLTKSKNIHVRFIEFMPFDGNKWDWSKGVSLESVLNTAQLKYNNNVLKLIDKKNDTAKNYTIGGHIGTFAVISSVTNPFCDTCNRIRLTANGKIKNCLFSQTETDLLTPLRNGENIKHYIFEAVWNKKSKRGGMNSFEEFSNPELNSKNRSMVMIGG